MHPSARLMRAREQDKVFGSWDKSTDAQAGLIEGGCASNVTTPAAQINGWLVCAGQGMISRCPTLIMFGSAICSLLAA